MKIGRLALAATVVLLALAGTATAHNARHRARRLDCANVQTMTTQWLCERRIAAKLPLVIS